MLAFRLSRYDDEVDLFRIVRRGRDYFDPDSARGNGNANKVIACSGRHPKGTALDRQLSFHRSETRSVWIIVPDADSCGTVDLVPNLYYHCGARTRNLLVVRRPVRDRSVDFSSVMSNTPNGN